MPAQFFGKHRGVSTLEILIAFAILTLALTAVVMVVFGTQSVAVDTQNNIEAISKAQALLEQARSDAAEDFNLVNPKSSTENSGPLAYTKSLHVQQIDLFTKQVTSLVEWNTGGRSLSVSLSTRLSNPEAVHGGDTCSSVLTGNWKNPVMIPDEGWDLSDLGVNTNSGNGFGLSSVTVFDHKLYVGASEIPNSYHDGYTFFAFDLTNPLLPRYLGGAGEAELRAIAVSDGYAFGARANSPTVDVFDLGHLDVSTPIASLTLSGITGTQAGGKSLYYHKGYLYVGLTAAGVTDDADNGPEFHIIDVSDPTHPHEVGSWPPAGFDFNTDINAIYVRNGFAYLAHPEDNLNNEQLTVLDLSDPTAPHRVSGFYANGSSGGNGKSLTIVGPTLYFGRTASKLSGANDAIPEFFVLDGADPSDIPVTPIGSLPLPRTADSINNLSVRDYLAFFVTNNEFQVWNISNLAHIVPWTADGTSAGFLPLPSGKGTAVDCENNYFYVISQSSQGQNKDLISVVAPGT